MSLPAAQARVDAPAAARQVAATVLRRFAADVDDSGRFPRESVEALRQAGLLAVFVPPRLGGPGGGFATLAGVAAALGESCAATALIWAMHCQQVAVLARHGGPPFAPVLGEIAARGLLVASVTSEAGKGGDLLTALAPLERVPGGVRVRRRAPIVSYGGEADLLLVTMRAAAGSPPTEVRLVLVDRRDGGLEVAGGWDAMGMRGTRSVPMELDVVVPSSRVLTASFGEVAVQSMIPAAHVGWSAVWLGAARGAFRRFVGRVRGDGAAGKRRLGSDLFLSRLAELRLRLDLVDALLSRVCERLDALTREAAPVAAYNDATQTVELNNLKVAAARGAFAVVDGLVELAGLEEGYLKGKPADLERVFRDLRSAGLMYHNDRLLLANGRLLLVEESSLAAAWSAAAVDAGGGRTEDPP